jgi:hypothetical protein
VRETNLERFKDSNLFIYNTTRRQLLLLVSKFEKKEQFFITCRGQCRSRPVHSWEWAWSTADVPSAVTGTSAGPPEWPSENHTLRSDFPTLFGYITWAIQITMYHSLAHSPHSLTCLLTQSLSHSPTQSFTPSHTHLLNHPLNNSLTHKLTHSTQSITRPPTHSITHSLINSLTQPSQSLAHPPTQLLPHSLNVTESIN